jgi:hypothetical protein
MYELWDSASGSAMGAYATEAEALAVIRTTVEVDGSQAVATLALLCVNRQGRAKVVAEGAELAARAVVAVPVSSSAPRRDQEASVPA